MEKKSQRFNPANYMICIIHEFGHRRVFCPDFAIHFTVPVTADPHKWTAITLQQMEKEIEDRLRKLELAGEEHPHPKKWRDVVNALPQDLVSIDEASIILGVSKSTLRRISATGKLPAHETPGGHRRYSMKDLHEHLNKSISKPS